MRTITLLGGCCLFLGAMLFGPSAFTQSLSPHGRESNFFAANDLRPRQLKQRAEGEAASLFLPYSYYATALEGTIFAHLDAVVVADFNSDGRNDIAMSASYYTFYQPSPNDGAIFLFYQNAAGVLEEPVRLGTAFTERSREHSIAAGDVNGDGRADIVSGNHDNLQVFLQTPAGTMQALPFIPNTLTGQVRVGDVTGDGRNDIVSIGYDFSETKLAVWAQNPQGQLGAPQIYDVPKSNGNEIEIGDLNGDGRRDIAVLNFSNAENTDVQVFLQNMSGSLLPPVGYEVDSLGLGGLAVGDVTGDRLDDIVVTHGYNNTHSPRPGVSVLAQNQAHTFEAPVKYATLDSPGAAEIADVNNDGRLDVITVHRGWEHASVYLQGVTGELLPGELLPIPYNFNGYHTQGLTVADINSDGQKDIVIADNFQHKLVLLYHQTPGETPPLIDILGPNGGENLVPGTTHQITWDATSSVKNVRLEYSLDGLNFIPITRSTPNTGSFAWQVPERGTSYGIIRIFDASGRAWDTNDAYFNISSCQVTLTPINTVFGSISSGIVLLSTGKDCAWEVKPDVDWITVTRNRTGQGNAPIEFTISGGSFGGPRKGNLVVGNTRIPVFVPGYMTSVLAAHYKSEVAPDSIVSGFGQNLASGTASAPQLPLPTALLNTTVKVRDRYGVERFAPLFYVSPTQINYQVPPGTPSGACLVTILNGEETVAISSLIIRDVAYGIFSADATGQGPAAAYAVRVNGTQQRIVATSQYEDAAKKWVNVPIDLDIADEEVVLVLHGTGLRYRDPAKPVEVRFGNHTVYAEYAGEQGYFAGLDQINVRLPKTLRGLGEVSLVFVVDGIPANNVSVAIK